MSAHIRRLRRVEDVGASAVEYGLMVAAIAAVIVATVFALGTIIEGAFRHTCTVMATSPAGGDPAACGGTGGGGQVPPPAAPGPAAP